MKALRYEKDFRDCMLRMTPLEEHSQIMEQLICYKNKTGDFSMKVAIDTLPTTDPSK